MGECVVAFLKMMGVSDIFGQMTLSRLLQNVEKMGEALNC
jgi:hypothetical protein